jgi:predicted  nucleic acid-binding Zn-ribbon protein
MRLPAQEVERVRNAEGLIRCDECRRILVVL